MRLCVLPTYPRVLKTPSILKKARIRRRLLASASSQVPVSESPQRGICRERSFRRLWRELLPGVLADFPQCSTRMLVTDALRSTKTGHSPRTVVHLSKQKDIVFGIQGVYGVKPKRTVRNSSSIFKVFVLGSRLAFWTAFSAPFLTWQAAAQYYHSRLALGFSFLLRAHSRCTLPPVHFAITFLRAPQAIRPAEPSFLFSSSTGMPTTCETECTCLNLYIWKQDRFQIYYQDNSLLL